MAFEKKPNTWALFLNKRKDRNDPSHERYADRDGSLDVEQCCSKCGHKELVSYFMNGWLKKAGTPDQFISGTLKAKQPAPNMGDRTQARQGQGDMNYDRSSPTSTQAPRSQRPLGNLADEIPF